MPIALCLGAAPAIAADTLFEFHNTNLDHYFLTIDPAEAAAIDGGAAGAGWQRTAKNVRAWRAADAAPAGARVVCRFYGNQANGGPNGHFYTADADECAAVRLDPGWSFERNEFFVTVPAQGACPDGAVPVYRNYNGRFAQHDSNHRYTADPLVYAAMIARGWSGEGVVFCGAPAPAANWTRQPSNTADVLLSVSFPTATTGYASGINGRILRTADGGASWAPVASGVSAFIRDVHFVSAAVGTAVGERGLIRRTTDGATWAPQSSGTSEHLVHVHFIDAQRGMVSGQGGVLLRTQDGGATWAPMASGTTVELPGVFMIDATTAWAVGFGGTIRKTTDGGNTWTPQASGVATDLRSVWFSSAQDGWVVGMGGTVLRTVDGGATWQRITGVTNADLYAVAFADGIDGIMAGTGRIFRTADGGSTWVDESPAFSGDLYSIAIDGIANVWAVGQNGTIFRR